MDEKRKDSGAKNTKTVRINIQQLAVMTLDKKKPMVFKWIIAK